MSALGSLGNLNVVFSTSGLPAVQAAIQTVQAGLKGLVEGLKVASVAVTGFVTAGLASSAMGERLTFQMGELSRVAAGLFTPEIEKVIGFVRDLTGWFRSLTEAQKDTAARFLEVGAAVAAFASGNILVGVGILVASFEELQDLLGGVMEALKPVAEAGGKLFDELIDDVLMLVQELEGPLLEVLSAVAEVVAQLLELLRPLLHLFVEMAKVLVEVLKPILTAVAAVLRGVAWVLQQIVGAIKWLLGVKDEPHQAKHKGDRGQAAPRSAGFGSVEGIWDRIALASVKVGALSQPGGGGVRNDQAEYREKTADSLEKIRDNTGKLLDHEKAKISMFKLPVT